MAKQQEPKPENVKNFIVVVSVNDYDAPTEVYTFHGTYRRACKKAVEQFLAEHSTYEYERDKQGLTPQLVAAHL
ncbi:hypothetical protein [Ktedonobacter racemifer]|uniref:Uncharacterized protein n=1 Tax=Ktedonobacter racemifer DSM 44963 TaxID=485913 RepID=D6U2A9_KTERA|nr:hypothetical protein [Ktedonobacter racemifer]EFH82777.1 hypothetical protein Krac_3627 [Ktedonobacter racemifer DSM 44963]